MSTSNEKNSQRKYRNLTEYRFRYVDRRSPFYEEYGATDQDLPYEVSIPENWAASENATWKYYYPPTFDLPRQGWKIHVSARPGDDQEALRRVSGLLIALEIPFKHLVSKRSFMQLNMKYANRASSGKLITIYPANDEQFCSLLEKLDNLTEELEGPYILSDTKFGRGPVYFRYGGFYYRNRLNDDGSTVLAIQDPEGNLIEDVRSPTFVLPEFVSVPDLVYKQVNARLNPDASELTRGLAPYVVQESLHFSNGGGVYTVISTLDGTKAVLKEARPYAGYTSENEDAIARLRHERDVLCALQDVENVPRYLGYKKMDGHEFLVESFLDGASLQSWLACRYPFSLAQDQVEEYSKEALTLAKKVVKLVEEIHSRGYALMDINAKNFIVDECSGLSLIDFEGCRSLKGTDSDVLGTPGFVPLVKCSNAERDAYGLANLMLYMFWPSWASAFSPEAMRSGLESVAKYFPKEVCSFLEQKVNEVPDKVVKPRIDFVSFDVGKLTNVELIQRLICGIRSSRAKMTSESRRYPGDATQFLHGRLGMLDIETGAAGVMLMMSRANCNVRSDMEWILEQLSDPEPMAFHGLLRGVAGMASVFSQAGFSSEALGLLPSELPETVIADVSVKTGIAGTVLALCQIARATNDQHAKCLLRSAASSLRNSIETVTDPVSFGAETGNAVGIFDGWAGAALACRELAFYFDHEPMWTELMDECLRRETQQLFLSESGSLFVNYAGINFGYLSEGSAGVACALAMCDSRGYAETIEKLHPGLIEVIALNGGLLRGLGGKIAALLAFDDDNDAAAISLMMGNALRGFLFADATANQAVYVLGDGGACLSADYSSGAAGLIGLLLSLETKSCQWFPVPLH